MLSYRLYPDLLSSAPKKLISGRGERTVDPINAVSQSARPVIAQCVGLLVLLSTRLRIVVFVDIFFDNELLFMICHSHRIDISPVPRCSVTRLSSVKTETAAVISKDATATKFNVQYLINYDLYNLYKNCSVFQKEITTVNSYNVKSDGYSFGTDLSQKETSQQIIRRNINEFIFYLNTLESLDKCAE